MKAALLVLVVSCANACAGREPATTKSPDIDTTVVEVPPTEAQTDSDASSSEAPPTVAAGAEDLEACVTALREARDVSAGDEERSSYDAALSAERADDLVSARKSYFELVSKQPRSRLVPLAYLAFGELFAREAQRDTAKRDLAKAAYEQVLRYPPPDNTAYAYALLRLAETESDGQHALAQFVKAIDASRSHAELPCAALVRERATEGSIRVYVEVGRPDRALAFFRAKLDGAEVEQAISMLADEYVRKGNVTGACGVLRGAASLTSLAEKQRKICSRQ